MNLRFAAPWSNWLTAISALMVFMLLLMAAINAWVGIAALVALLAFAAATAVIGYTVDTDAVIVRRPGWETRLDLAGLESAEVDTDAFKGSIRTFGMGGPFAFLGRFRSKALGPFSAYATDPSRAVVLRWPDRTVVVTPDDPGTFVAAISATLAERDALPLGDAPEAEWRAGRVRTRS